MARQRLDILLTERGLAESRARAQALVMAGAVYSGDRRLDKPGRQIETGAPLAVRRRACPWVSRGGVKLAHALEAFGLSPRGRVGLDIGASTGGFSDVLLANGAARVYAVDVGRGQLAWRLRNDPRVVVLERTNARFLDRGGVPEPVGALTCDASFIGLSAVLPAPLALCAPGAWAIALIKPQFEAGRNAVGRGGVVRDPEVRRDVCEKVGAWFAARPGWSVRGTTESPVTGPAGNIEYLIAAERQA